MSQSRPSDAVDTILQQWARERPDLDASPMAVIGRVGRCAALLRRELEQVFAAFGLSSWEFDVLAALRRAGAPYELSPGRLLRETLVTSGTMTNRVDRLVARGFVERLPDPRDRRGVLVRLTDAGRATVDSALSALLARERELLAGLDPDEQKQLADLLRSLVVAFES